MKETTKIKIVWCLIIVILTISIMSINSYKEKQRTERELNFLDCCLKVEMLEDFNWCSDMFIED